MENQHRKITGYRELSQEEIDAINAIKDIGNTLAELFSALESQDPETDGSHLDKRWLAIAKTHLQLGFMALTRSIAKPESF